MVPRFNYPVILSAVSFVALLASSSSAQDTWHVKESGNDVLDGTSFATAFASLEKAFQMAIASPGPDHIKVAIGSYTPQGNSFQVPDDVVLEGGYLGSDDFPDPDPELFDDTILDGLRNRNVVLTCSGTDTGTIIRGFKIRKALLHGIVVEGVGTDTRPRFEFVTVEDNANITSEVFPLAGAGMHVSRSANFIAFPELDNCHFQNNVARGGGGIFIGEGCTLHAANCVFEGNQALSPKTTGQTCTSGIGGGAVWNTSFVTSPSPEFFKCQFLSNLAGPEYQNGQAEGGNGGAILNNGRMRLLACHLFGNTAQGHACLSGAFGGNGGAIFSGNHPATDPPGHITLNACRFVKNHSMGPVPVAAGVEPGGGGIYSINETLLSTNCVFKLNDINDENGIGAAIACL